MNRSESEGEERERVARDECEVRNHIGALNFPVESDEPRHYGSTAPEDHGLGYIQGELERFGVMVLPPTMDEASQGCDVKDRAPITVFKQGVGGPIFLVYFNWKAIFSLAALLRAVRLLRERGMPLTIILQHSVDSYYLDVSRSIEKVLENGSMNEATVCVIVTDTGGMPTVLWIPEDFTYSMEITYTPRIYCYDPDFNENVSSSCLEHLATVVSALKEAQSVAGTNLRSLGVLVSASQGYPEFRIGATYDFWRGWAHSPGERLRAIFDKMEAEMSKRGLWSYNYIRSGASERDISMDGVERFVDELEEKTGWKVQRKDMPEMAWESLWNAFHRTCALGAKQGDYISEVVKVSDMYVELACKMARKEGEELGQSDEVRRSVDGGG